jgi:hypothetical protein
VLLALVDQRGGGTSVQIVEAATDERKPCRRKVGNRRGEIKLSEEPGLHGVTIRRLDIVQVVGHQRSHVPVDDRFDDPVGRRRRTEPERDPAAALVYQRQQHTINVFISPAPDNEAGPIESHTVRGFHVRHWARDGMSFWAVSDLNDEELTQFVATLRGS